MSVFDPRFIQLTVLGSRSRVAATPAAIEGSAVTLWIESDHRIWNDTTKTWDPKRTAYSLTEDQAQQLAEQIAEALRVRP